MKQLWSKSGSQREPFIIPQIAWKPKMLSMEIFIRVDFHVQVLKFSDLGLSMEKVHDRKIQEASFWKEVSHKSFVFELQSFIFEGSLAQKLRF